MPSVSDALWLFIVQVASRGRLQIVAGERQNSNSVTKRRLTGGPGLPPIDGNVSCLFFQFSFTCF
jgi:hypothetical protein